ncbi:MULTISPECIES: DUF6134 family protein [Pseudovibrio]|uniref:DUF6134 family protein n=1 Tax=Stappiaceae TaxID=2821832 RepID=UPI0023661A4C|nr:MULTISPECIES: DUF6134 family protein [Pseudovibrio]MDD7911036.1 DUF6134 family protein [Pseudovibrio exalbescens]MDX5593241.1 DUF6134 family protein [Pseudovibrio sp. SPO723]
MPSYRSALIGALFAGALSAEALAAPSNINFTVERDGKPIGTYTTRFSGSEANLNVSVDMRLRARFLGIPVYRFNYSANERWSNGTLQALEVDLNNNGEKKDLAGKRQGNKFVWTANGENRSVSGNIFPSNHWNPGVLQQRRVLNTLTGKISNVSIRNRGTEQLQCENRTINATRYQYTGQIDTEAWYDSRGRWVGLRFKAQDGSTIFFRCKG